MLSLKQHKVERTEEQWLWRSNFTKFLLPYVSKYLRSSENCLWRKMGSILLAMFAQNTICCNKYLLSRAGYHQEANRNSCWSSELLYRRNWKGYALAYFRMKTQQTHLGSDVLTALDTKSPVFLGYNVLHAAWLKLFSCMASSKTLKMEATYFPRTSVEFQWTIRRHIPEDKIHHNMQSHSKKCGSTQILS